MELDGPRLAPASGQSAEQLVLLLHGVGADGNDLIGLASILARVLPNALFVSPHAPFPFDMAPTGRQWFSLRDYTQAAMLDGVRSAAPVLNRYIDAMLAEAGLAEDRLVLFGFSQGCMMSLYTGLRRKAACAGILGYSGMLLGADELAAEITVRPPVMLVHGELDEVVPAVSLQRAQVGLEAVGVAVETHLRPGLGHGIDPEGLQLAAGFLQRRFGG